MSNFIVSIITKLGFVLVPNVSALTDVMKVTVHIGTDQNIETNIFAKYRYTLNELPVNLFSIRLLVCEIWRVFKVVLWWP